MKKLERFLEKFLLPIANFVNDNKELSAVKDGMIQIMPVMIVGSLVLIITNFPFLNQIFPDLVLWNYVGKIFESTMALTACFALIAFAYNYSENLEISPVYGVITAFSSYFVLSDLTVKVGEESVAGMPLSMFSSESLFTIIIVSLLSVRIFAILTHRDFVIKMPKQVPINVARSFSAMIPLALTLIVMLIVQQLFALTSYGTLHGFVFNTIVNALLGFMNSGFAVIFYNLFSQILWFFGLHGGNIVNAIFGGPMQQMTLANLEAFKAGTELPYIYTFPFQYIYVIGGAGGILAAITATFIVAKSKQAKAINKISFVPSLFNIQEPWHFGFPSFMNPILFIPYILVPVLMAGVAYILVLIGFAPMPVIDISWTVPIFLSGFISTDYNIMGTVTQLILFVMSVIIWIPFIKVADNLNLKREKEQDDENKAEV